MPSSSSSHSSSVDEEANALEIVDFSFFFFFLYQSIFFVVVVVVVVGSIFFPKQLYIFIHVLFGWFERWIHGALRCNHWTCVHFLFMSTQVQSNPLSFFFAFIIFFFKKKKIMLLCDWRCIKQESLAFKAYEALQ